MTSQGRRKRLRELTKRTSPANHGIFLMERGPVGQKGNMFVAELYRKRVT